MLGVDSIALRIKLVKSFLGLFEIADAGIAIQRFQSECIIQRAPNDFQNCFLRRANRLLSISQDHLCVLFGSGQQRVMGYDSIDQTQAIRFLYADLAPCQRQVQSGCNPRDGDESHETAIALMQAIADLEYTELGFVRCDANVARQR